MWRDAPRNSGKQKTASACRPPTVGGHFSPSNRVVYSVVSFKKSLNALMQIPERRNQKMHVVLKEDEKGKKGFETNSAMLGIAQRRSEHCGKWRIRFVGSIR